VQKYSQDKENERKKPMRGSKADIPIAGEMEAGTLRVIEWGGMTVEFGSGRKALDPSPFYKGLPDDRCQCPHWGYVIEGQLRYRFADHEEVYQAGDAYYAPPGHTPLMSAHTEYVEFSPTDGYQQTMEVLARNVASMQQSS